MLFCVYCFAWSDEMRNIRIDQISNISQNATIFLTETLLSETCGNSNLTNCRRPSFADYVNVTFTFIL